MTTNYNEPGNTLAQARDIGFLSGGFHLAEWVGSSDVRDIYSFTTHQVGDLRFRLKGLSNNANIQLLDSDGNIISGSYNSGTQDEFNTRQNLKPGDYYIKVYSNSPGTNYSLDLRHNISDANNYFGNAQNVGVVSEEKHIIGWVGLYDTKDVYHFTTHQLGDLDFSLKGLHNNANIQLLDSNENIISGSYNGGTQDESNTYEKIAPGE